MPRRREPVRIQKLRLGHPQPPGFAIHGGDEGLGRSGLLVAGWSASGAAAAGLLKCSAKDTRRRCPRSSNPKSRSRTGSRSPTRTSQLDPAVSSAAWEKVATSSKTAGCRAPVAARPGPSSPWWCWPSGGGRSASWPQSNSPVRASATPRPGRWSAADRRGRRPVAGRRSAKRLRSRRRPRSLAPAGPEPASRRDPLRRFPAIDVLSGSGGRPRPWPVRRRRRAAVAAKDRGVDSASVAGRELAGRRPLAATVRQRSTAAEPRCPALETPLGPSPGPRPTPGTMPTARGTAPAITGSAMTSFARMISGRMISGRMNSARKVRAEQRCLVRQSGRPGVARGGSIGPSAVAWQAFPSGPAIRSGRILTVARRTSAVIHGGGAPMVALGHLRRIR